MEQYALRATDAIHVLCREPVAIEAGWDLTFGDRKNEIVFIGQDMDEEQIRAELNSCLATEGELASQQWVEGYEDEWPIPRAYALE